MPGHDRWLESEADRYESALTDDERQAVIDRLNDDTDRRYDELRDREVEVPRDE